MTNLQQVLRMPAAAAINVVENEDAARMYEEVELLYFLSRILSFTGCATTLRAGEVQSNARFEPAEST